MKRVKWGILSTAKIAVQKVIPAMQKSNLIEVAGISSRDLNNAKSAASSLGIEKYYGSYDELLEDPEIEAIYNPLPNHLHFEWTKKAMEKGKHVLCEKPLVLDSSQIEELINLRDRHRLKVGEAFMVDSHPQWIEASRIVKQQELGKVKSIQGFFSYFKTDPNNIRNIPEYGGGAIWDIGCYPVHVARMIFACEPKRVCALIERDPQLKIDRLSSVILDFQIGHCLFSVSTQLVAHQRMIIFGDEKKLEIEIPFNAPNDLPSRLFVDEGSLYQDDREVIELQICDQYQMQGEDFSNAILNDDEVPVTLENAFQNAIILESIFKSASENTWIDVPEVQ